MGLTIYDIGACFSWQKTHAHEFVGDEADRFCEQVVGYRWIRYPSVNHMHGYPVELVTNTAGCFVMSFAVSKLRPTTT